MNCVIIDDDTSAHLILRQLLAQEEEMVVAGAFTKPSEAILFLKKNKVDIVFLDIEMPEMSGIDFLETFEEMSASVIFTTSHEKYAVEAFNFNVIGYLVKPIRMASFKKAIKKAKKLVLSSNPTTVNHTVFIKKGSSMFKIDVNEVNYIECNGDYVNIFTDSNKFTIHATMKEMERKFAFDNFLRVHRSYIIQKSKIERIEDDTLYIYKKPVPIGKTYRQDIYRLFNIL